MKIKVTVFCDVVLCRLICWYQHISYLHLRGGLLLSAYHSVTWYLSNHIVSHPRRLQW